MSSRAARADLIRSWPPEDITKYKSILPEIDYGTLYSVYADLNLAQAWKDVDLHPLSGHLRPLVSGVHNVKSGRRYVYPLCFDESTSIKELETLFTTIEADVPANPRQLLLGIVHVDSSVVYYVLNDGIVKPTVN